MSTGSKLLAVLASIVLSCPCSFASAPTAAPTISAKLTEAHGNVFKRGFVDWDKDEWADPEPARLGDSLNEGMQVGTGDKSWAEVTWPNVTTRAWANSVFAIAPNQRLVYLMDGQMLFNLDKHRKDKKDFFVWTKVLQARIRGTTVMLQANKDVSRITVLEGVVEVLNRIDHSVIKVTPGVVYEVKTPPELPPNITQETRPESPIAIQKDNSPPQQVAITEDIVETTDDATIEKTPGPQNDKHLSMLNELSPGQMRPMIFKDAAFRDTQDFEGAVENTSYDPNANQSEHRSAPLHEIALNDKPPVTVFTHPKANTQLFVANADSLLAHPLVQSFDNRLPSLGLVQQSLLALPPIFHPLTFTGNPVISDSTSAITSNMATVQPNMQGDALIGCVTQNSLTQTGNQPIEPIDKTIAHNIEVMKVPSTCNYLVGPSVGAVVTLPPSVANFPPLGVLGPGPIPNAAQMQQLSAAAAANTANMATAGMNGRGAIPPQNMPQGTFVSPTSANINAAGTFVPPTMPQTSNFIPPTMPQTSTFVPPTMPQVSTFVPPTMPQVSTFVPPTMPQVNTFVPPTMPQVNTFIPPTTMVPVNTFVQPTTTPINTYSYTPTAPPPNYNATSSGYNPPNTSINTISFPK